MYLGTMQFTHKKLNLVNNKYFRKEYTAFEKLTVKKITSKNGKKTLQKLIQSTQ